MVQYTELRRPVGGQQDVPARFRDRVLHLNSWKEIARAFDLPYVEDIWECLLGVGPPECPPPTKHPHLIIDDFVEDVAPKSPRPVVGARSSTHQQQIDALAATVAQLQQVVTEVAGVATVQAQTAAVSAALPTWSSWESAQHRGHFWHNKKLRKAMQHAAGQWPPPKAPRVVQQSVMCVACARNQPGAFCFLAMCRPCCDWERASRECP